LSLGLGLGEIARILRQMGLMGSGEIARLLRQMGLSPCLILKDLTSANLLFLILFKNFIKKESEFLKKKFVYIKS
jgi:hypothetical protein